jgi:lipoprotein NlpI
MSIFHDAMRSVQYDESDPQKIRKEKRNDKNHEKYGAVLFEKLIEKIQSQNDLKKHIQFSSEEKEDISEYLINHDFFSEQLNGKRFHEPKSKEGQIVRLADRISIPLKDEIQRYRDTGKRLGTPFFNTTVSLDERENFSFDNMGYYFKNGKIDEVLFFTALLMITEKDFNDPLLGQIYKERAIQKKDAVQFIMDIAQKEDTNPEDKQQLQQLLTHLGKKF